MQCSSGTCGECKECVKIGMHDEEAQSQNADLVSTPASPFKNSHVKPMNQLASPWPPIPQSPSQYVLNTMQGKETPLPNEIADRTENNRILEKNSTSSEPVSPFHNFLRAIPSSDKIQSITSYDGSPLQSLINTIQGKDMSSPKVDVSEEETIRPPTMQSPQIKIDAGEIKPLPHSNRGMGVIQPFPSSAQNVLKRPGNASTKTVQTGHNRQNLTPFSQLSEILQVKPIELSPNRRDSIALFAKPSLSKDDLVREDDLGNSSMDSQGNIKRVSIHQDGNDGEEFEIDFEEDSVLSNNIDPQSAAGFVNGDFTSGKLKEIETSAACFTIKFNLDSSLLAVALKDGHGVELYETQQFRLIYTIERSCTVSAMDWVEDDEGSEREMKQKFPKAQLLAIGGFDGFVKVYSISMESKDLVHLVDSFYVQSEICSLSFLKDNATQYAPTPRAIAIGEKNGRVSIVTISQHAGVPNNAMRIKVIDQADSAVLSLSFGFSAKTRREGGITMVYGTKFGKLSASMLYLEMDDWTLSHHLFQLERTGAIRALRFNHDSSLLIVGGYDKTVLIIDADLWKIVRELYMDGTVQSIEFDPFNRYLLLGNRSKMMTVVDSSTLHPIKTFQTSGWVTSISWGGQSTIAIRSDDREVSLILFEPIQPLGLTLDSTRGEDCCISWSSDGRFLARTKGNDVIITDSKRDFGTVAKVGDVTKAAESDVYSCVKFCHAKGKRDRLAVVGRDGFLKIVSLRVSVGKIHQQLIASIFVEKNLKSVAWSPDGTSIVCGGREMKVHILDTTSLKKRCEPVPVGGRIWTIDSLSQTAFDDIGKYALSFGMAITSGRNRCSVLDLESNVISIEITRKRTVRCQTYHPKLPVLAIGDGSSEVMIVDLVGERKLASFFVGGRVNTIAISPAGDYIIVGTDEGIFTIHDTVNFKCVQEIRSASIAMNVEFSGSGAQYIAMSHANGDVKVVKLGPLLSIDYTPLHGMLDLPDWAKEQVMFRSPEGPSFLQRCMLEGSKESLLCAGGVLDEAPESVLTFDRTTGVGCFETAVELRKPNIMKLILTPVVNGTLDSQSAWSSSLLTTTMPVDAFLTLRELITNHPPGYATDILSKMTYVKVPFAGSRRCHLNDPKECGSDSYINPWGGESIKLEKQASMHSRFGQEYKDEIILIPAVLPIPGLGSLDFLSALLAMPNTGSEIFDNDAMGLVLAVLWNAGIKYYFFVDFFLNVLFCLCWVHFVDRSASSTSKESNDIRVITALAWTVMLLNTVFLIQQGVRFDMKRGHFFRSKWHFIEFICIVLVFAYSIIVIAQDSLDHSYIGMTNSGKGNVPLAVVTTLFLTAKFISMLRGFEVTGYLVAFLLQSFLDVRGFIIVILSILMGFTVAFRLLLAQVPGECKVMIEDENTLTNDCDSDPFGNLSRAVLSTFELTILGSYENGILYDAKETFLVSAVFVIAVTVILVIALNALIAVLGDSFSRVQENVSATRQRERAELVVEYLSMMPIRHRKRIENTNQFFHALLDSDGHGDLLRHRDDWQGGFNALKRELTEITEANNAMTQRAIDQLRREMTDEISSMLQNEVTSVLNNVFLELKEMRMRTRKVANAAHVTQAMGGNSSTPFGVIRKNVITDDRSTTSMDLSEENYPNTLISI